MKSVITGLRNSHVHSSEYMYISIIKILFSYNHRPIPVSHHHEYPNDVKGFVPHRKQFCVLISSIL